MGDILPDNRQGNARLANWFWDELSDRLGNLKKGSGGTAYVIAPKMTESAKELMIRLSSMWSDSVYLIDSPDENTDLSVTGNNLWTAPVVNLYDDRSPLLAAMTVDHHGSNTRFLMPALGSAKAFMRTYLIRKNTSYSRLHSHSAVEEHYLVLKGRGSVRYGGHTTEVKEGDIISKPVGPDNYSQILADRGEEMTVLDMEIWPDTTLNAKDTVIYPDHNELFLRGQGWGAIIQTGHLMGDEDFQEHYSSGYARQPDGSWKPKKMPGYDERR